MRLPQPRGRLAWFFDLDGTLVDLAPTPEAVQVPQALRDLLARLQRAGVALAVVSGRSLESIDALLAPLRLPAAGVHGAQRRDVAGRVHGVALPQLDAWAERLRCAAQRLHPDLLVESKPGALALHCRQVPQLWPQCVELMDQMAQSLPGFALQRGKMVVEIKPAHADKGQAVRAFLAEPPFRGRQPWYFGDDLTDEPAFAVVQAAGGVGVKIGEGETAAAYRLRSPEQLRTWLHTMAEALAGNAALAWGMGQRTVGGKT